MTLPPVRKTTTAIKNIRNGASNAKHRFIPNQKITILSDGRI
jgi:hypothetical protein